MKQNIWPQYLKEKNNGKTTFAFLQFTYASVNNKIMLFEKSHTILKRMILTYSLRNWNHFPLLLLYNQYFHARVQLKSYCHTDNARVIHGHLNQDYSSRSRVFPLETTLYSKNVSNCKHKSNSYSAIFNATPISKVNC